MGLFTGDFRFLVSALQMGVNRGSALTISRHPLFFSEKTMDKIAGLHGESLAKLPRGAASYLTDDVLRAVGFERTDVMDISDYEGANILQDLNRPVPDELENSYDLIVDGGTLEHVYNFPVALENVMRMAKVGGHVLLFIPTNNYCGHGFYQVSPELFFRAFAPANGFEIARAIVQTGRHYHHVADPVDVRARVELVNSKMSLLMIHAVKTAHVPMTTPLQSDYVVLWDSAKPGESTPSPKTDGRLKAILRKRLSPSRVTQISNVLFSLHVMRNTRRVIRSARVSNRSHYCPVGKWDLRSKEALASNK